MKKDNVGLRIYSLSKFSFIFTFSLLTFHFFLSNFLNIEPYFSFFAIPRKR